MKGGRIVKPSDGSGDDPADHAAEAERRRLEELRAREADELVLAGSGTALWAGTAAEPDAARARPAPPR